MQPVARAVLCLASIIAAGSAAAQQYPTKVVRFVTAEAGGGGDFVTRVVAQGLTEALGQQVIVENRGGVQAMEAVARAAPDGYTVLLQGSSIWLMPYLRESVAWDPLKDYAPVTIPASSPNIVVVHPSLPVKSIGDMISYAKKRPGDLNFGALVGGSAHLAAELFKSMAGVNLVFIPFRGNGPAMTAVMGGQIHMMFPNAPAATPHVKSGRLRALAVTSAKPSQLAPGLPTVSDSGLPGYETASVHAILVPVKTPQAVVTRLNQEIVKYVQTPEATKRLLGAGVEPWGSTPEDVTRMMNEMTRMGKVIRDAGIKAE